MTLQEDEKREELRVRKAYEDRERLLPADRHSLTNPGNLFIKRERERHLLSGLQRLGYMPLHDKLILDIGCGPGYGLQNLQSWGAKPQHLFGIDLIPSHVERAKRVLPPQVTLEVGNATKLNYADDTFDLVQQFTVFSSILHDATRTQIAAEMVRVLKTGGYVIWYDFFVDNPWNPDVRGVGKRAIRKLFPQCCCHFERVTVAPPISRLIGKIPLAYDLLAELKVFSTHYVAFLKKKILN